MPCSRLAVLCLWLAAGSCAAAQEPATQGMSLQQSASRRFPQPVVVATLLHRAVIEPVESQNSLGRVRSVVRRPDGQVELVMSYGGFLGFFSRPIAVPIDAVTLLGQVVEVMDFTPAQLGRFPTFAAADATPLPPGDIIKVGLAKPPH